MGERLPEQFLEACGVSGPIRLSVESAGVPWAECFTARNPFVVIGRDADMDLCLAHPDVSRRHVYLQAVAGRLFCIDLQSRDGTHWGEGSRFSGWFGHEGVRIGPFRLRPWEDRPDGEPGWAGSGDDLADPTSRSFEKPGLQEASLEFLSPGAEKASWRVSRALVLMGRSRGCKIQLAGPETSLFHCSLVRAPSGVWLVDLLSRSGTLVNGVRVRSARLNDGDELTVGSHRIRFREGAEAARRPRRLSLPDQREPKSGGPAGPPGGANLPVIAVSPELVARHDVPESLLRLLLEESGRMQREMAERMQQSMADQFQQALLMMFRMFSGMHQEQMGLIREELARVHQLTLEQQALQNKLAALTSVTSQGTIPRPAGDATPRSGPSATGTAAGAPGDAPAVTPGGGSDRPRPLGGKASDDVHAALMAQIAAIQTQRQGRWQNILAAVTGQNPDDALP